MIDLTSSSSSSLSSSSQSATRRTTKGRTETVTAGRRIAALVLLLIIGLESVMMNIGLPKIQIAAVRGFMTSPTNFARKESINRTASRRRTNAISPTMKIQVRDTFYTRQYTTRAADDDGEAIKTDNNASEDSEAEELNSVMESMFTSAALGAGATPLSQSSGGTNDVKSVPFQGLFQSTLQRAYSTTATLNDIRNNIDDSAQSKPPTASKNDEIVDISATVNSIVDATIVETEINDAKSNPRAPNSNNDKESQKKKIASAVNSMLDATIVNARDKYSKRTETQKQRQSHQHYSKKSNGPPSSRYEFPFATSYKSHPALNNVALAHALWASIIRPNVDSVIDATCGNGNDSIVLAEILFGREASDTDAKTSCELLCVDIQSTACERTSMALKEVLPPSIEVVDNNINDRDDRSGGKIVKILNASHERLPRPSDSSSVGLIVYNLGWLPGSNSNDDNDASNGNGKDCVTTMETTLMSLVDATSLLRVGGMLSVVTYPQTGPDEDTAVRLFVTCLALLSSRTKTWQEAIATFVENASIPTGGSRESHEDAMSRELIAKQVSSAMESVIARGDQTWRVSQHDKLGMDRPPVLFTATRIK